MKNNLGKLFVIFLALLHVELFASSYEWSAKASKNNAYVNEAIYLSYTCIYSDRAELYSIEFNPVGEYEDYDIKLLTENTKVKNGKKINHYEFIAFLKKDGDVKFDFTALIKKTNEDSIKNTVLGRDNAFYEEFTKVKVKQKTLHVEVKKVDAEIVGQLSMKVTQDALHVKAFTPFHMQVSLEGIANLQIIKPIKFKIDGVKIFTSKILQNIKLTKDGYSGTLKQKFAFVSDKEFIIPDIKIKYFDLNSKSIKFLSAKALHVKIDKGYEKAKLLDDVKPKSFKVNYEYFYYVLFFILGFLLSKIGFKKHIKKMSKDEELLYKIKKSKNMDEVIIILLLSDEDKYRTLIKRIENKELNSTKEVKKELLNIN